MEPRYWFRPVFSVALRDIKITLRYKSWVVALLVWPVIFPLTFYFMGKGLAGTTGQGLGSFERLAQTGDYASFLILGNLVWLFININLWMGGLSLQRDRMLGTFDTHWTMPASKISLVLGATLASIALNFFPLVIGISFYSLVGAFKVSANYFSVLFSIIIIRPFLIGFLLVFAALTVRLRQAGMSVHITRAVLSIICGLQFPLAVLPDSVSKIGKFIPLTHFVNMIRGIIILKGDYLLGVNFLMVDCFYFSGGGGFQSLRLSCVHTGFPDCSLMGFSIGATIILRSFHQHYQTFNHPFHFFRLGVHLFRRAG